MRVNAPQVSKDADITEVQAFLEDRANWMGYLIPDEIPQVQIQAIRNAANALSIALQAALDKQEL